ncbi:MAG: D-alanyl-D-alanine carboxypeptidase [Lachnospiraceae bacterium]|jgi:D-alanyl-D-alanine carboxypeptidase (penicillin-binding protein 5/6)|nr:D-alanyl-D-alanine carboxypeptidase [Lachnospiraceae bacterium]
MVKKNKILFGCLLTMFLIATGCSRKGLEQPYNWEERDFSIQSAEEDRRAAGFASELCVLSPYDTWEDGTVDAEAAAVFSLSDSSVIYGKNAFEQLYPASITKVMTAMIAIKYGNLEDLVTVPQEAVITEPGATLCGIKPGEQLTLEQLLYGLMLPSGNDAGAAIAVHMAGSIEGFSEMMNQEAFQIGATQTHFMNPHGLTDQDHYTTAYDLYLIFNEALKLPKFREVTGTTAYTANYTNAAGEAVSKEWKGGNWFMTGERETPAGLTVFGGKTGTTQAAGYCLIMASRDEEEKEYISVVLKAASRPKLYENMTEIIQKIVN